jgi:hypothetical protein
MKAFWLVVLAACGSAPAQKPVAPIIGSAAPDTPTAPASPHESRLAIAKAAFTALSSGDVDALIKLSDAKAIYEDAMACESTEMETKAIEQKLRVAYRQPAANAKGSKIEVLAVEDLVRDEHDSVLTGKRVHGCTARVDVHMHDAKVKVKVTKDADEGETVVKLGVVEVEGRWYLRQVPARVGGNAFKPMIAKFTELTEKMCKCTDGTCAEAVQTEYYTWLREVSSQFGQDERPDDATMATFTKISERYMQCYTKASGG